MFRGLILFLTLIALPLAAQADDCGKSEPACVLDAAWSATLILPDEKRDRLASAFLEIAVLSKDASLISFWEARLERREAARQEYPDYGWQKAEPILNTKGVDGLIAIARARQAPLSFGRADALLSVGRRLRLSDPDAATRLNEALLDLSRAASDFEKPGLAHAAAELAMIRCDMPRLTQALSLTDAPGNLRYAFWKLRITGDRGDLLSRVRNIENEEDTREVRRVLGGYRAILELGYCDQTAVAIGG